MSELLDLTALTASVDAACAEMDRLRAQRDDLLTACRALIEFQRVYQTNTYDTAPGNDFYAGMLMDVVLLARLAVQKAEGQ